MSAAQTQLEIMLRVVAEQARRELAGTKGDVQGLTGAARDLGAQSTKSRDGLAVLAAGAAGAGQSLGAASIGATDASNAMSNMVAAAGRNATAIAGLQNAVNGTTASIAAQVNEMLAAQREAAAWQSELDQLRARFNPLFAASQQYEAQLREIAEAEHLGALSTAEANAARTRAAQILAPLPSQIQAVGVSSSASAAHVANLGYQFNDIGMMVAAGQNPFMLMMQQGTQVTQVFGQMRASGMNLGTALRTTLMGMVSPTNIATMAVIGLGAAAVQWFVAAGEKAKTFEETLADLEKSTNAVEKALKEASRGTFDLRANFGDGARAARELNLAILGLAKMEAAQELKKSMKSVSEAIEDMQSYLNFGVVDSRTLEKQFNLTARGAQEVSAAIQQFQFASTFEDKVEAAKAIAEAMESAEYNTEGANEKATDFGTAIARVALGAKVIKGENEQIDALMKEIAKSGIDAPFRQANKQAMLLVGTLASAVEAQNALNRAQALGGQASGRGDGMAEWRRRQTDQMDMGGREQLFGGDAGKLLADLQREAQISQAIVQYGNESLQVKRLKIAEERADFEAQLDNLKVSENLKQVLLDQWDITKGLKSADPFGSIATAREMLRTQTESLGKLQLELSLTGQTEATRRRILALYDAETEIRTRGIDPTGAEAALIRGNAAAIEELETRVKRVQDAWDKVRDAGEGAIDGVFDALKQGDIGGAFESVVDEIASMWEDLALKNPLKNAILGTDYATMADVGGLQGIWGRLTGQTDALTVAGVSSKSVGSMSVTATQVILNGTLAGSVGGVLTGAAGAGTLSGAPAVQEQVWSFFAAKGLKSHQIAAIMGNAQVESRFNPLDVGDNGTAFGLFQWNDRKNALFDFIGGKQNLGDVKKQLEFAWHEMMTSEAASMQRLMSSTNVYDATKAFVGFERPSGYTAANPTAAMHWDQRLASAEAALAKFETSTLGAGQGVSTFASGAQQVGAGLQNFGASIASTIQSIGAQHGIGGAIAGTLLTGIGGLIGLPGFAVGGPTGGTDPTRVAGLVHEGEYVFDAAAVNRIGVGNLETIRQGRMPGYASGGYVAGPRPVPNTAAQSTMAAAMPARETRAVFEMHVSGTGNSEIRQVAEVAMREALNAYDRDVLASRVRQISNDPYAT
ncbi:phage tail tip lysozyme [Rhodobacter maris]|uniref:Tail length tape measure protein n=1 Tax=Rhodobacter maris TaxID=446682 RepID=A0A285TJC1_9RHOB|nr:phage tail tip lysozyme [Rhodobacter maris]SOC20591.1 tail length tape measure protein [Rhodobacter maris]